MKGYWTYRLAFFACIALSVGAVLFTVTVRQRGAARAEPAPRRPAIVDRRPRDVTADRAPVVSPADGPITLTSRVRITTVVPYRREIEMANFGDAAEDLSDWRLVSPRPGGGDDFYYFPVGTVLLPGEALLVLVDEGIDEPGELHWRVPGDRRVLELSGDTVILANGEGIEVSRFQYTRS